MTEPTTASAVLAWIETQTREHDRFAHVARATEEHRLAHGCDTYHSGDGPLLGVLAAATGAKRILEVGCGLGYSALWLAYGASPDGVVETIELDPGHASLARELLVKEGFADRITVHEGRSEDVVPRLVPPFDMAFYDASVPTPGDLDEFARLVRGGGLLVTSNLFLGQHDPNMPGLEEGARYRMRLLEDGQWLTSFAGAKAISVRLP